MDQRLATDVLEELLTAETLGATSRGNNGN
jgi:hypothetical protein